jgi:membrane-bound lytic murein transglycosylase MltF
MMTLLKRGFKIFKAQTKNKPLCRWLNPIRWCPLSVRGIFIERSTSWHREVYQPGAEKCTGRLNAALVIATDLSRENIMFRWPHGFALVLFLLAACGKKEEPVNKKEEPISKQAARTPDHAASASADEPPPPSNSIALPLSIGRHTGDLDEMLKRRNIRALVLINRVGFFYDQGHPKGVMYEALEEFQSALNKELKTGALKVNVSFIPMNPAQIEAALTEGLGDLIAYGIVVTPEREKRVAFSAPIQTDVTQIIVTGSNFGPVSAMEDFGGKVVYVNPLTTYFSNLQKVNESLQKAGKPPITIKEADKNLTDDDLLEMVNAGLIPATVTTKQRAQLWSSVFNSIKPHPELPIAAGQQLAWVMRKNNPQLKQAVDNFVQSHAVGTAFGNTLVRRYLQNTKFIRNSTSEEEMKKYEAMAAFFQKYATEYNFDYLMLTAQGYQESLLDQSKRNRSGAVGIMQVIPKNAAASPIDIPSVSSPEANIHAGAKMLRSIADTYFNDPKIDSLNKTLFVFASYNAGPNRIARLRREAPDMGLDPNIWFGNVELLVAKDIGQETVTYVGNIYKYYVAYKLAVEQRQLRKKAEAAQH